MSAEAAVGQVVMTPPCAQPSGTTAVLEHAPARIVGQQDPEFVPAVTSPEVVLLRRQLRNATNRVHYLEQELVGIMDQVQHRSTRVEDHVFIGRAQPLAGSNVKAGTPVHIPIRALQRSVCMLGRMGAGKTNGGILIARALMPLGVGVVTFDHSGEWRPLYGQNDIVEGADIQINVFENYGLWDDRELQQHLQDGFFTFFSATHRGPTNRGSIAKLLRHYLVRTPVPERDLETFAVFVAQMAESLGVPGPTAKNIMGYLDNFLHDPTLSRVFLTRRTSPVIARAIATNSGACIVLGSLPSNVCSIVTISVVRQITARLEREFLDKGSTEERVLSQFLILEETKDIIVGDAEKEFLERFHRVARKFGVAMMTFPRNESTLADLGVDNLISEVGLVFFFPMNEYINLKNKVLTDALKAEVTKLDTGHSIAYMAGHTLLVKWERAYMVRA